MTIFILVLFIITVVWGVMIVLKRAPKYGPWFLIRLGLVVAVIAFFIMALTGKIHFLLGVIAGLLPFAKRYLPLILLTAMPFLKRVLSKNQQQAIPGQQSEVVTNTLKMTLDHDSGDMEGEILDGPYQDSLLSSLSFEQLQEVYQYCLQHDGEAARLLDSYFQRHFSEQWQQSQQHAGGDQAPTDMTIDEALDILELDANPSDEDIQKAHKRMMAKFHPDKGGSHYMAVKINQAKELLLSQR